METPRDSNDWVLKPANLSLAEKKRMEVLEYCRKMETAQQNAQRNPWLKETLKWMLAISIFVGPAAIAWVYESLENRSSEKATQRVVASKEGSPPMSSLVSDDNIPIYQGTTPKTALQESIEDMEIEAMRLRSAQLRAIEMQIEMEEWRADQEEAKMDAAAHYQRQQAQAAQAERQRQQAWTNQQAAQKRLARETAEMRDELDDLQDQAARDRLQDLRDQQARDSEDDARQREEWRQQERQRNLRNGTKYSAR